MQHIRDTGVEYFVVGAGHLIDPSEEHKVGLKLVSMVPMYDACLSLPTMVNDKEDMIIILLLHPILKII